MKRRPKRKARRSGQQWSKAAQRVFGQVGHAVGLECEDRVLTLLQSRKLPAFCTGVRKASPAEDEAKMDIIVETDVGPVGIQVKRNGYRAHVEAHFLPENVFALGASEGRADGDVWRDLMQGLVAVRRHLQEQGAEDAPSEDP